MLHFSDFRSRLQALAPRYSREEIAWLGRRLTEEAGLPAHFWFTAAPTDSMPVAFESFFADALPRLAAGEPWQYVLAYTYFAGCRIGVDKRVLIPRPETEYMLNLAMEALLSQNRGCGRPLRILDICTGSGCLAIGAARHCIRHGVAAQVAACDLSPDALEVAVHNARTEGVAVAFIEADLGNPPPAAWQAAPWDLILCNPPYVRDMEKELMSSRVLDYEPSLALFVPDENPLKYYKYLAQWAGILLRPNGGLLYAEINEALGPQTSALFPGSLVLKDLCGRDRFLILGRLPSAPVVER